MWSLYNNVQSIDCPLSEGLQFSEGIGDLFQFRGSLSAKSDVFINPCPSGETRDPISLICRPLTCIPGYVLRNDKCVLKNGTSVNSILGNWTCKKYDSLYFAKGLIASLTSVDRFLENNSFAGSHVEYIHEASSEDEQLLWLAIRFTTSRSVLLFREIDAFVPKRKTSDIYNDEFLTVCYHELQDINCSSSDYWYSGPPLSFIKLSHPLYDNVYLSDGVYIKANIVMFHSKYERDNMDTLQRKDVLMICGSSYEMIQPDCLLIALSPQEYIIVNESVLIYRNMTINDTDFSIQPDGQALVCTDIFEKLKSDNIGQNGDFFSNALDIVSFVASCVSMFGLLGTCVTYTKFKSLRNMYGKCIMVLSSTLFLAQLFTFLSSKVTWSDDGCIAFAITTHYLWLASFAWSTNSAVVLLQQFVIDQTGKSVERISFVMFANVFGFGAPMLIVLITFAVHICECIKFTIYGRNDLCWIQDGIANLVSFGVPVSLLILTNGVILSITVFSLRRSRH